jgi:putative peptidoglycan lipid II flippase
MVDAKTQSAGQTTAEPTTSGLIAASTRATLASLAGSAPGFFIPIGIAAVFGASAGTDAFFIALAVSSFIANTLGATTPQTAIPFLIQVIRERRDVGRFLGEMTVVLLALATIPTLAANVGVPWYLQWADPEEGLLKQLLWGFVPYVVFAVVAGIYSAALNAQHAYVRVAASPALRSLIVLAALLMAPLVGVYALILGYVTGEMVRAGYLLRTWAKEHRVRYLAWPRRDSVFEFPRSALAQMVGSGMLAFVPLVDRVAAARLGPGSVSLLDYADRLWQVPLGFVMSGLMVTTLSHWSERLYRGGSVRSLSASTVRLASALFAVLTPIAMIFGLWRRPLIGLVFRSSSLTTAEVDLLADTLAVLVAATPAYVAGLTYTRAFLVLKRSDWLLLMGVLQLIAKVGLNTLLGPAFGLVGIGLATALTYGVSSLVLVAIFHLRLAATSERA